MFFTNNAIKSPWHPISTFPHNKPQINNRRGTKPCPHPHLTPLSFPRRWACVCAPHLRGWLALFIPVISGKSIFFPLRGGLVRPMQDLSAICSFYTTSLTVETLRATSHFTLHPYPIQSSARCWCSPVRQRRIHQLCFLFPLNQFTILYFPLTSHQKYIILQ